ncbi:MAG: hypothetical protein AB7I32_05355 [Gammaproteobacteria bacterium]
MHRPSRCVWTLVLIGNAGLLWQLARGAGFELAAAIGLPAVVTAAAVFCLARVSPHEGPQPPAPDARRGPAPGGHCRRSGDDGGRDASSPTR